MAIKVTVVDIVVIDSFVALLDLLSVAILVDSLMPFVVSLWVPIVSVTYLFSAVASPEDSLSSKCYSEHLCLIDLSGAAPLTQDSITGCADISSDS